VERTLVAVRDPREVAASLGRRDGIDAERSADLWLRYTAGAMVAAPDALAVRYDDWFADPDRTLSRVAAHLDLPPPGPDVRGRLEAFVDPGLRRSTAPTDGGGLLATAVELYGRLETGPVAGHLDELRAHLAGTVTPLTP
jgi:hypothetical protein